MKKLALILLSCFFTQFVVAAFQHTATLSTEGKSFAKNQPIVLTLQVNGNADKVSMPVLADFDVLSEPGNKKTITETKTVDDVVMTRITQTYTLAVTPKKTGELTIEAFTFVINGKQLKTNILTLNIEDRKVSWADSALVAQEFTGISIGSEATQGVKTKTAIDYNKTDKTLVQQPASVGTGVTSFTIQPVKTQYKVKAGEYFTVEYNLYKEAPKAEFSENIEMAGFKDLKDFTLYDGPARHLSVKSNTTTKVQSGTTDAILQAPFKTGTYKLSALQAQYGDELISSSEIEIVVE